MAAMRLLERPVGRSDRRLARRASRGDREAVGVIFERYREELYRFCLGLLGEPQDAQDALQNTMVKALRALPGEEREIALRPWLYRIAHNEAIELRRNRRQVEALDGHLLDGRSSVPERAEQRERLQWVLKDLDDLPERQRAVLVMRELSGLDFAEIGAALGASGAVVRQALYEARRNLEQMDLGRSLRCEAVTRVLSDGDGRVSGRREIRAHLRGCSDCRQFKQRIQTRREALAGIAPLPAAAAAGILQSAFGGAGGSGAGELAAALGASAAKTLVTPGLLKALATIAAVTAVGTAAVEQGSHGHRPGAGGDTSADPARQSVRVAHSGGLAMRVASPRRRQPAPAGGEELGDRGPAGASPGLPEARRRGGRVGGVRDSAPEPRTPAAEAGATAPVPAATGVPAAAGEATLAGSPEGEQEPIASASNQGGDAVEGEATGEPEPAAQPEHPAAPAHPQHPPRPEHPAQSRKPPKEEPAAAPAATPEEATPAAEAEADPAAPESSAGNSDGKAKGKEKKTQG